MAEFTSRLPSHNMLFTIKLNYFSYCFNVSLTFGIFCIFTTFKKVVVTKKSSGDIPHKTKRTHVTTLNKKLSQLKLSKKIEGQWLWLSW